MRQFLALVAAFVIVGSGCSRDDLEIPDGAARGSWSSDCVVLSQKWGAGPLSQKISLPDFLMSSGPNAIITNFSDTACTSPYSSVVFNFTGALDPERDGSNTFKIPLKLTKVEFTAHSNDALKHFIDTAKKKDASYDGRSLVVGTTFDATDKTEQFQPADATCRQTFQFHEAPDRLDEKYAYIDCVRGIDERVSLILIPGTKFRKIWHAE